MGQVAHLLDVFVPKNYQLYFDINRQTKKISGVTKISGRALKTDLALHQKFLNIKTVKVNGQAVAFTSSDDSETVNFTSPTTGPVELEVSYDTALTDTMMGIYPSYYEVDGVKKQLIGTQFETTSARQAFPSVDEPAAKAIFEVAIKFDEQAGETVLSNMPEVQVEDGVHYFAPTLKMSTYLVAFAFGDLQAKKTETKSGVEIGVFATKAHQAKELDFALDIAKRSIEFFEDYYQTPYPLPHSWQLALPDFSAGAMENWGLVTYREAYLLLDPDNTPLATKRVVATVIAHELAHQWFGDLVTMNWWEDLWLNESFANMMEYVAIDALEPNWKIWEAFQTSEAPLALQRDATDGVQSVFVEIKDPAEIDSLFDGAIVYAKGSRLLVMVRALIGDQALRTGLKNYFADHQYANSVGADLWDALGQASGLNIGAIMKSWLEQPGYPALDLKVVDGDLIVSQKQFFIGQGQDQNRLWQVPLHANFDAPQLLTTKELNLGSYQELRAKAGHALRLNLGNTSHLVVDYSDELLADILTEVDTLSAIDQLQLLQDLRLLAESGRKSHAELLPLLLKLKDSKSAIVTETLSQVIAKLKFFVNPDSQGEKDLKALVASLSQAQLKRLGLEAKASDSNDDLLVRPLVLDAALYAENAELIAAAHDLFLANQAKLVALPVSVRALVLKNEVLNFNSDQLFDNLLVSYQKNSDSSFKQDLLAALTKTKKQSQLEKLVSHFEDADVIKPQDLRAWYVNVLANPRGEQLAWDWLRNEWSWLEAKVGGDMEFPTYLTVTARVLHTAERLAEFKAFFEPKLTNPEISREITMDTKVIASRVDLIQADQANFLAALAKVTA
ncbi:M1 family metallopeptidase [Ligilactobacillus agilis]|uniref:M1 family metallopeptidase n=1 Tax=Ligilactobacillus agilis TaxID=1601 RepID=UPI001437D296|nr:M1 family metallopeptidase [Ligilactobacillus agilis]GET16696.1 aminopeptidase N [Ligilactobacillus agilis]